MQYHHVGIPTQEKQQDEIYVEGGKVSITDAEKSEFGIEWLRFDADSPMPELVKKVPHVAFVVDDLDATLAGKEVIMEPFMATDVLRVAFIVADGAPIELMQRC